VGGADKLRGSMDVSEYKHVVLGSLFLKYVSDSFEELYDQLKKENGWLQKIKMNISEKYSLATERITLVTY